MSVCSTEHGKGRNHLSLILCNVQGFSAGLKGLPSHRKHISRTHTSENVGGRLYMNTCIVAFRWFLKTEPTLPAFCVSMKRLAISWKRVHSWIILALCTQIPLIMWQTNSAVIKSTENITCPVKSQLDGSYECKEYMYSSNWRCKTCTPYQSIKPLFLFSQQSGSCTQSWQLAFIFYQKSVKWWMYMYSLWFLKK